MEEDGRSSHDRVVEEESIEDFDLLRGDEFEEEEAEERWREYVQDELIRRETEGKGYEVGGDGSLLNEETSDEEQQDYGEVDVGDEYGEES